MTYYDKLCLMLSDATKMRSGMFPTPASDLYMRLCGLEKEIVNCINATPEGADFIDGEVVVLAEDKQQNGS